MYKMEQLNFFEKEKYLNDRDLLNEFEKSDFEVGVFCCSELIPCEKDSQNIIEEFKGITLNLSLAYEGIVFYANNNGFKECLSKEDEFLQYLYKRYSNTTNNILKEHYLGSILEVKYRKDKKSIVKNHSENENYIELMIDNLNYFFGSSEDLVKEKVNNKLIRIFFIIKMFNQHKYFDKLFNVVSKNTDYINSALAYRLLNKLKSLSSYKFIFQRDIESKYLELLPNLKIRDVREVFIYLKELLSFTEKESSYIIKFYSNSKFMLKDFPNCDIELLIDFTNKLLSIYPKCNYLNKKYTALCKKHDVYLKELSSRFYNENSFKVDIGKVDFDKIYSIYNNFDSAIVEFLLDYIYYTYDSIDNGEKSLFEIFQREQLHIDMFDNRLSFKKKVSFTEETCLDDFILRYTNIVRNLYFRHNLTMENYITISLGDSDLRNKEIIKKSVQYFINNEYDVAIHLMVPQIENSFRELLDRIDINVVYIDSKEHRSKYATFSDLLQKNRDKIIQQISLYAKLSAKHSSYIIRFLEYVLLDYKGKDVRNRLAHGSILREEIIKFPDRMNAVFICLTLILIIIKRININNKG